MVSELFHRGHYNVVAAMIRRSYPQTRSEKDPVKRNMILAQQRILEDLALGLAHRFLRDNPLFDPVQFLESCSPDIELYPLGELWQGDGS